MQSQQTRSELTTRDILRIIPMEEKLKTKILELYPNGVDYETSVKIEELAWDTFYSLFEAEYDLLIKSKIADQQKAFSLEMHEEVMTELERKLKDEITSKSSVWQLEDVRKQLESITNHSIGV